MLDQLLDLAFFHFLYFCPKIAINLVILYTKLTNTITYSLIVEMGLPTYIFKFRNFHLVQLAVSILLVLYIDQI